MIHAKSGNQGLNTKSSTEAELLGVIHYLSCNINWISSMKEQGYKFNINKLNQYNQSSISMEQNCRYFGTGNSRHVKIH